RVRLVDREQRSVPPGQLAERVVEARLRMDDADVRQRGLREDDGDVAPRQLTLERVEVVELDDPSGEGRIDGGAEVPAPGANGSLSIERRERLVDGAVVAPVEDEDG